MNRNSLTYRAVCLSGIFFSKRLSRRNFAFSAFFSSQIFNNNRPSFFLQHIWQREAGTERPVMSSSPPEELIAEIMSWRPLSSALPMELVSEILSWLPVTPLLRFKSVNQTWNSVISDPEFAKLQLSRSTDCKRLLLTTRPPQSVDYEALRVRNLNHPASVSQDDSRKDPSFRIIGSCNGLICILDLIKEHLFIWNPTTGECSRIPDPGAALNDVLFCGFGYHRYTADYQVLFASSRTADDKEDTTVELYNLRTRTWKRIEGYDLDLDLLYSRLGLCWNGDLYYMTDKESVYTVACFDMVEERFKKILPVPDTNSGTDTIDLGMCRNNLCVYVDHSWTVYECLELKMEGNQVYFNRVFRYSHALHPSYAMCLTKRGEVLMDCGGRAICLYDPEQDRANESFWLRHDTHAESELYLESLVPTNP